MAEDQDLLFIAVGCTVGGIFLIILIIIGCCLLFRKSKDEDRKMKYGYHNAAFPSMPYSISSDPKGSSRISSVNLGTNRSYMYYDKKPVRYVPVGGYPLRPASSETQLYGVPSGFQRSVRRLQHFLRKNGESVWKMDVEDRDQKLRHEVNLDAGQRPPQGNSRANGVSRNESMTARMDIGLDETGLVDGDQTTNSKTKLFAISRGSYIARAYGGSTEALNTSSVQQLPSQSHQPRQAGADRTPGFQQPATPLGREDSGRYYARPSYQHYDLRRNPYSSQQHIYVSNPNVYFSESPVMVQQGPFGYSHLPVGNIVLSPAATFGRPNSARVKDAADRPHVQRSSSQTEAHKAAHINGVLHNGKTKQEKPHKETGKKGDKSKKSKKSPDQDKLNDIIPISNIDEPQANHERDIYAVPNKKAKKEAAKKPKDGEVKLISKSFLETPTRTANEEAHASPSLTRMEVKVDIESNGDGNHVTSAIYESVTPEPETINAPSPTSDKGYDTMDGNHVTATAFKFLENYMCEDDRFSTGGRKTSNQLVPNRSEMSSY